MSYAKYLDRKPAVPPESALAVMDNPINAEKALIPEKLNDLLNQGYFDIEAGWCVMPNGSAYVANLTKMPGVTVEMINWWFAWHALDPLRYKIWWPEGHYDISVSDEDKKKILDPDTPLVQKFQGIKHHVIEDIGGGASEIQIQFMTPEDFGFDMSAFKTPNVGTLIAGNGRVRPVKAPFFFPKSPAVMCHFVREIQDGIEFRTRFWIGYQIVNKRPKKKLPPFIKVPASVPKGLAIHNVYEYHNLASFLPQLYEEQKGIIE